MMIQELIVFSLISICLAYVVWQASLALRGRKSKLGSCCAKGCAASKDQSSKDRPQASPPPVHFIPLASVGRRLHK